MRVRQGSFSRFTNESKFTENLNTKRIAAEALLEGEELREKLKGKRILLVRTEKDSWELKNAFRL